MNSIAYMVAPLHVKPKQFVKLVLVIQEMQVFWVGIPSDESTNDFKVLF